ncbi:META domain-containing protein [Methanoregula sp.]|uniref:META domain-containing protein n=1 Tax=Methanoregula sp. TaxID=2052170 RepID=UPI0035630E4D
MNYIHLSLLLVLIVGIAASGCTSPQPAPATPVPTAPPSIVPTTPTPVPTPAYPANLAGMWVVKTMAIQGGSVPLTPTTEITLTLNPDGTLTGYGGCNNYWATYNLTGVMTPKGSGMTVGPITTSKKSCIATSSQETTYLQGLQNTGAYVVNGYLLTLTDKSQNALVFQQAGSMVTTQYYPQPA